MTAFVSNTNLSVREMTKSDVPLVANYWFSRTKEDMQAMGADINKLPARADIEAMLQKQLWQDYKLKNAYCIIWLCDDVPIGHSNTNPTFFAEQANMHLHVWENKMRQKGLGAALIQLTLPYFFNKLKLKNLICEPYALNPAPNKTLAKAGFQFEQEYITIPGYLNFEQSVNRWIMTRQQFELNNPAGKK